MKTLIAIPCMDMMPTGFVQSLLYLEKGENVSVCFKANSLVYDSRNLLALSAIEQGFDRVMWFDSDVMFTPATMKILSQDMFEYGAEMVTGIYFRRKKPFTPVIYSQLEEPGVDDNGHMVARVREFTEYPPDSVFPVRGCGFGCCMTSVQLLKEVCDKFGPPFSPYPWGSEDLSFCHRVNQLGYQIWCDSRVSCGHIGQFVYTEENTKRGDLK